MKAGEIYYFKKINYYFDKNEFFMVIRIFPQKNTQTYGPEHGNDTYFVEILSLKKKDKSVFHPDNLAGAILLTPKSKFK